MLEAPGTSQKLGRRWSREIPSPLGQDRTETRQTLETPSWPGIPRFTHSPREPQKDRNRRSSEALSPPKDSAKAFKDSHILLALVPVCHQYDMMGILSVTKLEWQWVSWGTLTYSEGRSKFLLMFLQRRKGEVGVEEERKAVGVIGAAGGHPHSMPQFPHLCLFQ